MKTIHLIPNAHLDQVWLWDWREGFNEAIATAQAVLELMERYPQLTFARGEANFYEPLLKYRPDLVERIRRLVAEGRWELVGGNYVQGDDNFPETATMLQQFRIGKAFFKGHFGVDVNVAWSADSAGHSAGLPDILAHEGFKYFGFSRPPEFAMHLPNHSFVWRGLGGAEILCARGAIGYQNERGNLAEAIESILEIHKDSPQENLFLPMGLGDHGGGPSARHVEEALEYAACHPEIRVEFSTFARLFKALEAEREALPVVDGELNFFFRGVYFNNAPVKHAFRDVEAAVQRAARTCAVANRLLGDTTPTDFTEEWKGVLFNTFHDILPGDSIDRVNQEQLRWMGAVRHAAEEKEYDALTRLGAALEMKVPPPEHPDKPCRIPFMAFNPTPYPFKGLVEFEAALDYRPLWDFYGHPEHVCADVRDERQQVIPSQNIETEHCYMLSLPWRRRELFELEIPPFGCRRLTIGTVERKDDRPPVGDCAAIDSYAIRNEALTCRVANDRILVERHGKSVTGPSGITLATYADRFGSWGDMNCGEESAVCPDCLCRWRVKQTRILESGPLRARLMVILAGGKSEATLVLGIAAGRPELDIQATVLWQERDARLRLCLDAVPSVTCKITGGHVTRTVLGDVPCGRWFRTPNWGFASDHVSSVARLQDAFCINLLRGTIACTDAENTGRDFPERTVTDAGRNSFHFVFTPCPDDAPAIASTLEFPPILMMHWPHGGASELKADFAATSSDVELLDMRQLPDGRMEATLQNSSPNPLSASFAGHRLEFEPWNIKIIRI